MLTERMVDQAWNVWCVLNVSYTQGLHVIASRYLVPNDITPIGEGTQCICYGEGMTHLGIVLTPFCGQLAPKSDKTKQVDDHVAMSLNHQMRRLVGFVL